MSDAKNMDDYVVVTAISSYRMRYVMHKDELQKMNTDAPVEPISWAQDSVTMNDCEEFSQLWLGETIIDTDLMNEDEMLELFDADNDYLKSWTKEQKLEYVRKA